MTWGNACHYLPRIRSHADAETLFNSVTPVRSSSWAAHQRPLAKRGDLHKRIERIEVRDTGAFRYALVLYNTALVVYHPHSRVDVTLHDSMMSRDFFNQVLPPGMTAISHQGATLLNVRTPDGDAWYDGRLLRFAYAEANSWTLENTPEERKREFLCLKRAAQIRKAAKPFLTWVKATRTLLSEGPPPTYMGVPRGRIPESIEQLQDITLWHEFAQRVVHEPVWLSDMYDVFGARTVQTISNHEPPRRSRPGYSGSFS